MRWTLSRFHFCLALAALLAAFSLWSRNAILFTAILLVFVMAVALGVAIPQLRFFGSYVCRGTGTQNRVALTFDDGPDPRSTPALLDLLQNANVKAAFFCIGKNVVAHPELAERIAREGHLVENHSYSHSNATNIFTVTRLREELTRTQTAITQATGATPKCFRPPIGLSNPRIFRVARELGLAVVGWTARGLDTKLTDPNRIVSRIERKLKPDSIILLHDGNIPSDRLVPTVRALLDTLRGRGYEVVRLDKLIPI